MEAIEVNGIVLRHGYSYDPTYGYGLNDLLGVLVPEEPEGFVAFWEARYERALAIDPQAELRDTGGTMDSWRVMDLSYRSTDGIEIGGWALVPIDGEISRGMIVGHGYGGREAPEVEVSWDETVYFFPCMRGFNRSRIEGIPEMAEAHVVHGIEDKDSYVIGGCVDDLWTAVTAMLELFPQVEGRLGYFGGSFGGGLGALMLPWDDRIRVGHLSVPTFGQQPLRIQLPSSGSATGVQDYVQKHPGVAEKTLCFFDAAIAIRHVKVPVHFTCALFDPCVCPPGQFAIYNGAPERLRALFVQVAGHHEYVAKVEEISHEHASIKALFAQALY